MIADLIAESRDLEEGGRQIQGERTLCASEAEINELVDRYHDWFGRALALLSNDLQERFRSEYQGSWHANKIKNFFESPGQVSLFWSQVKEGEPEPTAFPYWQHPYDTAFHGPLLAQRQILTEAQQALRGSGYSDDIALVERICRGFGEFLIPLTHRQRGRTAFVIQDEYDVQDVLHGLLRIFFDDVRPEDFAPERAGARSRIDFVLKSQRLIVEAKMTRPGLGAAKVGEQVIIDMERYRSHPDCDALVALVYDPERLITNRRTLEADLSGERDGLVVRVVVVQ
jgi:hypothetical protein